MLGDPGQALALGPPLPLPVCWLNTIVRAVHIQFIAVHRRSSLFIAVHKSTELGTAARQANSWVLLSPTGSAPVKRRSHSVTWSAAADGMYVFGGWGTGGMHSDGLGRCRENALIIAVSRKLAPWSLQELSFILLMGFGVGVGPPPPQLKMFQASAPRGRLNDLHFYGRQAPLVVNLKGKERGRWAPRRP